MGAIDYEGRADAFRTARTLPDEALDRWREAVAPQAPAPCRLVLDLGAGTGGFLAPLRAWFGAPVIAVEPSPAMRDAANRHGPATDHPWVAGRAETIPLRAGTFDVAWLSTVLHQFSDREGAAAELRRVVRPGGRVLVRGFFSDVPVTGAFADFPGIERSAATFPSTQEAVGWFESAGFRGVGITDVVEPWRFPVEGWDARVRSLRDADSALRPLADDEIEQGIAAVMAHHRGADQIRSDATIRLLSFG